MFGERGGACHRRRCHRSCSRKSCTWPKFVDRYHVGRSSRILKLRNRHHDADFSRCGGWHCVGSGTVVLAQRCPSLVDYYSELLDRVASSQRFSTSSQLRSHWILSVVFCVCLSVARRRSASNVTAAQWWRIRAASASGSRRRAAGLLNTGTPKSPPNSGLACFSTASSVVPFQCWAPRQ